MNDPKKHKPLSAEELFKLLEEKNMDSSSPTDLDDFEKEALEGFSSYSSLEKAKALTEEINASIDTVIAEKKTRPASKIVWFSAAASLVILIMLSVFYLTETAKKDTSNLALNKEVMKPQDQTIVSPAEEVPVAAIPPVTSANAPTPAYNTIETKNADTKVVTKGLVIQQKMLEQEGKPETVNAANKTAEVGGLKKDFDSNGERVADNIQQGPVVNGTGAVLREDQSVANDEAADKIVMQTATTETGNRKEEYAVNASLSKAKQKETSQKDASKKEESKAEKNTTYGWSNAGAPAGKTLESPDASTNREAYYSKGTNAVKEYVVNRLKKKENLEIPTPNLYKITITVFTDGKIKVNTITASNSSGESYKESVTKALNTMTGWNAAVISGKAAESHLTIELKF